MTGSIHDYKSTFPTGFTVVEEGLACVTEELGAIVVDVVAALRH